MTSDERAPKGGPGFWMSTRGVVAVGLAVGVGAALLQVLGNPGNMGLCVVCFLRDIAGALGLHDAAPLRYLRPANQESVLYLYLRRLSGRLVGT